MKYKIGEYDLDEIQHIMLDMMKEVDRICRENNINYILDGGSMLGAVRHKGFIPWDDDFDIAMIRDDYIRFTEAASQMKSPYCFQCMENTKDYPYNFGKVFKKDTLFLERFTANLNICHGIYIDVFPMDYVDVSRKKQLRWKQRIISKYTQVRYMKMGLVKGTFVKHCISRLLPMAFVNSRCCRHLLYCYQKSEKVQKLCHFGRNKPPVDASLFANTIRVPFGPYEFPIPMEYDKYLRGRYGDYMQLPPASEQRPVHSITEVKL